MIPQYQVNLGQIDPLLSIAQSSPDTYISAIEQEMQKLNIIKQQLSQNKQIEQKQDNSGINIWDTIDKEIELFKQFQIAAQVNPNLTYVEFIKSIKK